ncbi:MAG: hypothetical protein A2Y33_08980 [Spirochaetes bacterium GWF1_51_8]|nr:MAG: hypothetical protein A2Y33_08980 [Spirochaetes bacterium GWF1_51_8]
MGKYDFLLKYLGNENKFDPNQLNLDLDKIENAESGMSVSEDDVTPESWDNIDNLINGVTSGKDSAAPPPKAEAPRSAMLDELSDMPMGRDNAMPAMDDLSEFSALSMEDADEDLAQAFSQNPEETQSAPEAKVSMSDVMSEEAWGAPEEKAPEPKASSPAQPVQKEETAEQLDQDTLDELAALDIAPPSLDELHRRFQSGGGPQDLIQDIMDENAEQLADDGEYEIEGEDSGETQPDFNFDETSDFETSGETSEQGELESEFSDILGQLNMEDADKETATSKPVIDTGAPPLEPGGAPETGKDLSHDEAGLGDLHALFDDSHPDFPAETETGTSGAEDIQLGDFPSMEESAEPEMGGFDESAFEMPDFGAEESQDLKSSEPDLSAFMDKETPPSDDLSALMEPEMGMPEEPSMDFGETSGEMPEFPMEEPSASEPSMDLDMGMDMEGFGEAEEISEEPEAVPAQPSFTQKEYTQKPQQFSGENDIELDESKALRVRNRINMFEDTELRKKLRKIFIDKLLPRDLMEQLVAMLILEQPEQTVKYFIQDNVPEDKIHIDEELEERPEVPKSKTRRVIFAEEARKAQEFQKELQNITKYAAILFGALLVGAILIWRLVWVPGNASRSYEEGIADLKKGDYVSAEAKFTEGENKGGPDLEWYNRFAIAYLEKNEYSLAEKKFQQALVEKPLDKLTVFNYSEFYKTIYPKKFDKAVALLNSLKKKSPDEFDIIDRLGQTYIEWGDTLTEPAQQSKYYSEAAKIYQEFLDKNNKHVAAMFRQVDIAIREQDDELITYFLGRIKAADPKAIDVETLTHLAKYYNDKRMPKEAKEVLVNLIDYIDQNLPKKDEAKKPSEKDKKMFKSAAVPKEFLYSEAYYEYARHLTLNMNFIDALIAASNSIILNNKNGKAYNLRGEIYYISEGLPGNIELAKREFETATNFAPYYYKPYANLGHIFYYNNLQFPDPSKSLDKALMAYKTARFYMPKNQKDFLLQYNLAWLYYREKSFEKASLELQDLYIDEPYNPILSYALGNAYFHTGKYSLAKTQYEKAIEYYDSIALKMGYINPELQRHIEIYSQLARAYNNKGVVNLIYAYQYAGYKDKYQQDALIDFYHAKNSANKIMVVYGQSEANIKYILNPAMKGQQPAFDDDIPMRTTLQDIIDEFRANLLKGI